MKFILLRNETKLLIYDQRLFKLRMEYNSDSCSALFTTNQYVTKTGRRSNKRILSDVSSEMNSAVRAILHMIISKTDITPIRTEHTYVNGTLKNWQAAKKLQFFCDGKKLRTCRYMITLSVRGRLQETFDESRLSHSDVEANCDSVHVSRDTATLSEAGGYKSLVNRQQRDRLFQGNNELKDSNIEDMRSANGKRVEQDDALIPLNDYNKANVNEKHMNKHHHFDSDTGIASYTNSSDTLSTKVNKLQDSVIVRRGKRTNEQVHKNDAIFIEKPTFSYKVKMSDSSKEELPTWNYQRLRRRDHKHSPYISKRRQMGVRADITSPSRDRTDKDVSRVKSHLRSDHNELCVKSTKTVKTYKLPRRNETSPRKQKGRLVNSAPSRATRLQTERCMRSQSLSYSPRRTSKCSRFQTRSSTKSVTRTLAQPESSCSRKIDNIAKSGKGDERSESGFQSHYKLRPRRFAENDDSSVKTTKRNWIDAVSDFISYMSPFKKKI